MESVFQDLRHASRNLFRSHGFTATAVVTLAVGIAAVTTVFSLLDAVLLRPLPFADPGRLVNVHERRNGVPGGSLSAHEVLAWRERTRVFDGLAMFTYLSFNMTGSAEPQIVRAVSATANLFDVLGARPRIGRTFAPDEDGAGANRLVVLSDRLWLQRFNRADSAVGGTLILDNLPYRIVGVMPPAGDLDPDLWVPVDLRLEAQRVGRHGMQVVGRLKTGVDAGQAERELSAISVQMAAEQSDFESGHTAHVIHLHDDVVGAAKRPLLMAAGAVAFVLLIACANVAHLLLTRTVSRQGEIAVRVALGAPRRRVVQFLLIESLLLGVAGGALGALLSAWIVDLLPAIIVADIPRLAEATVNPRVLGVCLGTALLTGALCGLLPALRGSRASLRGAMSDGARGSAVSPARVSNLLTASEVALAMMLMVGAALLIQSFLRLSRVDPGFNAEDVLAVPVALPGSRYAQPTQRAAAFEELGARLAALDRVQVAGAVSNLPLVPGDNRMSFDIEGRAPAGRGNELRASLRTIAGDYFQAMEIPLLRGRLFAPSDARRAVPLIRWFPQQPLPPGFNEPQPAPVAIVNDTFARRYWPDTDALGRRVRLLFSPWITIVGVVGDVRHAGLAQPAAPEIYLTHMQEPQSALTVLVRTKGDPLAAASLVREQVRALDKDLPVSEMRRMEDVLSTSLGRPRFDAILFGAFSGIALLLASIGIYSVTSQGVGQRTREIGIRTALGASRRDVLRLVLGRAARVTAAGIFVGVVLAYSLTQLLTTLLFGIEPWDPTTFAIAAAALATMALIASYIPARRALSIDSVRALRMDE